MRHVAFSIQRVDPFDLDLDSADEMASISADSQREAGLEVTTPNGPARLKMYQHSSDGTPFAGLWLARDGDKLLGYATAFLPRRDNTDSAEITAAVAVRHRRAGGGGRVLEVIGAKSSAEGPTRLYY
jgi:hypothetical protein